jgi:hypothetical protein
LSSDFLLIATKMFFDSLSALFEEINELFDAFILGE